MPRASVKDYEPKIFIARKFTLFALMFLLGILFSSFIPISFNTSCQVIIFWSALLLLAAFINFLLKNHFLVLISFSLLFLIAGFSYYSYINSETQISWPYNQQIEINGVVSERPAIDLDKQNLIIRVSAIKLENGGWQTLPHQPKLQVSTSALVPYSFGDHLLITAKISKPMKSDSFDYGRYLKKYPIYGVVKNTEKVEQIVSPIDIGTQSLRMLYKVSDRLEDTINRVLPEPHASLAAGILFGEKRSIPDNFKNDLKITGLTHIIALSGYNVTIIIIALSAALISYVGRKLIFFVGAFLVIIFVLMTGASPSIIRAAIFSLLIIFGRTLGRQGDQTNLMLLAAVIMVLFNPFLLPYDIGFQLSFLAFTGLIYLSKPMSYIINRRLKRFPDWLDGVLSETIGAQIAVSPLIVLYFGTFSLISPLANILILWILPLVMGWTAMVAILGAMFYPVGKFAAYVLWPSLEYIIMTVTLLARVPLASLTIKDGAIIFVLITILVICWIMMQGRKYTHEMGN